MAQLAVTSYTIESSRYINGQGYENVVKIVVGDSSNTYGTGIALTPASLGLPAGVVQGIIFEGVSSTGILARYDADNTKLKLHEIDTTGDTDKAAPELDSGDAPAAMTIRCLVKGY